MKKLTQDPDRLKALAILIVAIVIAAVVAYFVFKGPISSLWKTVTDPIRNSNLESDAKNVTGISPTLTGEQAYTLADTLYACFDTIDDKEEAFINNIKKLKNAADWHMVCQAFGKRECKDMRHRQWFIGAGDEETLPAMIANHMASDAKEIRNHLTSIGVANPGF